MERFDAISLNSRLDGINEAQKRSRFAFLLSTLAAGAILVSLWNAYFSWDRQWAEIPKKPDSWGQELLLSEQIKAWAETNTVDISLLGVRLSVSDAAVLGTLVLFIFSYYFCMCLRRENHEIGSLLLDVKTNSPEAMPLAFLRVRSFMVFNTTSENDAPYNTLENSDRPMKHILFSRSGLKLLTYLPVITIMLIVLSDIYFSFWFVSPWRLNEGPAWNSLTTTYRVQLVSTDTFAIILGFLAINFCKHSVNFQESTSQITEEIRIHLQLQDKTSKDKGQVKST